MKNLSKTVRIKQDLDNTSSQDLNHHVKKGYAINKIITVSSLQNNNNNIDHFKVLLGLFQIALLTKIVAKHKNSQKNSKRMKQL